MEMDGVGPANSSALEKESEISVQIMTHERAG